MKMELDSRFADVPTCQNTLEAFAPPIRITCRPDETFRVDAIWKMKIAFESPLASRVKYPELISSPDVDL